MNEFNTIQMNGYFYQYDHKLAKNRVDICLATENPKKYCNGYYQYSDKDPGTGKEFVIIDTDDPECKLLLIEINFRL